MAATASAAAAKPLPSLDFSADSPPLRLALTPDQYKYCSQALKFFKDKLQTSDQIHHEFAQLQVFFARCVFNFSQNKFIKISHKC